MYEISHVTRRYGREGTSGSVLAVDDVSLLVTAGQRVGIVGESGSGKSTLIRMMAALDQPTAGEIWFKGELVSGRPERQLGGLRAAVQLVFQDPRSSLNPRMKVGDIITEPLRSSLLKNRPEVPSDHRARLQEVMAAVDLPYAMASRYPHEFSGGQRQRIAIARALAPQPQVLIADEPVSALDVSVRAQVLNLLNDLVAAYGLTLVMVSHDLQVIRHVCDHVVVMRRGRIEEAGPTEQVYGDPQAAYTKELLAAVPTIRF
ncbi:MAG TPA: ATP-binding cassette domain-containing protein [Propionibacteriaceae bacterium]|nr:ATP-binding cassette domain-containing protein [Propionibacteriaceae bacterium]HPZ49445.1 ATP-binding cassette domain-containing protein [Propionibacteriaceae bacterium]HQE31542.1 ATP-binding cassette domain-containing protein [Propionibacteriaceae bacterium]